MTSTTRTVHLVFDLAHAPEKVWRALTDPALVSRWLMETNLDASLGGRFTFKTQASPWWDGIVHCEVTELEPLRRLAYSWKAAGLDTVVTWTLSKTDAGTRLELEQSGFPEERREAWGGAKAGWTRMAKALEEVLSS